MENTKKERREIYLKAAKFVLFDKEKRGCCYAISKSSDDSIDSYNEESRKIYYPEFALFSQGSSWWDWNQEERCIGMLLCAEMCS